MGNKIIYTIKTTNYLPASDSSAYLQMIESRDQTIHWSYWAPKRFD